MRIYMRIMKSKKRETRIGFGAEQAIKLAAEHDTFLVRVKLTS